MKRLFSYYRGVEIYESFFFLHYFFKKIILSRFFFFFFFVQIRNFYLIDRVVEMIYFDSKISHKEERLSSFPFLSNVSLNKLLNDLRDKSLANSTSNSNKCRERQTRLGLHAIFE